MLACFPATKQVLFSKDLSSFRIEAVYFTEADLY